MAAYTKSKDGIDRMSVWVVKRLSREDVRQLREILKREGAGRTIKRFVEDALIRGWQAEMEATQECLD